MITWVYRALNKVLVLWLLWRSSILFFCGVPVLFVFRLFHPSSVNQSDFNHSLSICKLAGKLEFILNWDYRFSIRVFLSKCSAFLCSYSPCLSTWIQVQFCPSFCFLVMCTVEDHRQGAKCLGSCPPWEGHGLSFRLLTSTCSYPGCCKRVWSEPIGGRNSVSFFHSFSSILLLKQIILTF